MHRAHAPKQMRPARVLDCRFEADARLLEHASRGVIARGDEATHLREAEAPALADSEQSYLRRVAATPRVGPQCVEHLDAFDAGDRRVAQAAAADEHSGCALEEHPRPEAALLPVADVGAQDLRDLSLGARAAEPARPQDVSYGRVREQVAV